MEQLGKIDVFILCGGLGKRLRPVAKHLPKSLVDVRGRPFLDLLIDSLSRRGFRRFVLGTGYKAGQIRAHCRANPHPGIRIIFSRETAPLGTGGAVKKARLLIKSRDFFVLNGDSFSEFDPQRLLEFHRGKKALASILIRRLAERADYGNIKVDGDWRIADFSEKKTKKGNGFINAGVYLFRKDIFRHMPKKRSFSLEKELFPGLIPSRAVFGSKTRGYFIDIGTPERYAEALKCFR
jgi:NDP-sugar pyrophosphorylase family protein